MRTLYLARHGEADGDLTPAGRQQSRLLGERLAGRPIAALHHSPVARAAQTAALVAESLPDVAVRPSDLISDHPPFLPAAEDLPPVFAPIALRHLADYTEEQRATGPALAAGALATFATPTEEDRAELLVTHSQMVTWFLRAALDAAPWRWLGNNAANAALTIIQYRPGWPASVITFNDQSHLPPELRWTGFPAERSAAW